MKCGAHSEDGEEGELDRHARSESGYWQLLPIEGHTFIVLDLGERARESKLGRL